MKLELLFQKGETQLRTEGCEKGSLVRHRWELRDTHGALFSPES